MERIFFAFGALLAGSGVAAGAFGAHGLKSKLSPEMLTIFETGVRYQMYHAFALMLTAWAMSRWSHPTFSFAGWLFLAGTFIFSGSLYILSTSGVKWWGAITPIGGLAFIIGWLCLAWGAWKYF